MTSDRRSRQKEFALKRFMTQYDELDMWVHNYLPPEDISEAEKEHLKNVMLKDQALKKTDAQRICQLTQAFPNKLRPEILSPMIAEMRQQNPAVPGSGLVSLCSPVALDSNNKSPLSATAQDGHFTWAPAGRAPVVSPKRKISPTAKESDTRCPFCFGAYSLFRKRRTCTHCLRTVCSRCLPGANSSGLMICRECIDIALSDVVSYLSILQRVSEVSARTSLGERRKISTEASRHSSTSSQLNNEQERVLVKQRSEDLKLMRQSRISVTESESDRSPRRSRRQLDMEMLKEDSNEPVQFNSVTIPPKIPTHRESTFRHRRVTVASAEPMPSEESHKSENGQHSGLEIHGELEVSLDYTPNQSRLAVMLVAAHQISAGDRKTGTSHPYAKIYLKPDPNHRTQRKVYCKDHTLSPQFNQGVCYTISPNELPERVLVIELWHKKSIGNDTFLGEAAFSLHEQKWGMEVRRRSKLEAKHMITTKEAEQTNCGEIQFGLHFALSRNLQRLRQVTKGHTNFPGTLQVNVTGARNLLSDKVGTQTNPFVRVTLLNDTGELEYHNTDVLPRTSNPTWNALLRFEDMMQDDLRATALDLSVWHRSNAFRAPEFLGSIRFALPSDENKQRDSETLYNGDKSWKTCTSEESALWNELVYKPGEWIYGVLPLHVYEDAKN